MKILIAEDDPISRRFLEKILQNLWYDVTACEDGNRAWEAFLTNRYGIVISDWMMPEMDGLELCRRVRTHNRWGYTYFIILTARTSKSDFLEAMDAGADDYLTKPLDTDEIKIRLRVAERLLKVFRAANAQPANIELVRRLKEG